jgi:2,5-diamino-6-(ribosylamino)-4(3H)-pyrimidinone 5'-phosphate reductase
VNLKKAMGILYKLGIKKLMVEGGGTLIFSLLKENLVDEINLKIGNLIIGGKDSVSLVEGQGFDKLNTKKVRFIRVIKKPNYLILSAKMK